MDITNSFEGQKVCDKLQNDLRNIRYNPDLNKMLRNIKKMVTDISKMEVLYRQTHKKHILSEPLLKLNESVLHLEKLIVIAKLME